MKKFLQEKKKTKQPKGIKSLKVETDIKKLLNILLCILNVGRYTKQPKLFCLYALRSFVTSAQDLRL